MGPLGKIRIGEYAPDQPDLLNPGLEVARNVIPHSTFYGPMPQLKAYAPHQIDSRALGAISVRTEAGSFVYTGDAGKLYQYQTSQWRDVSYASQVPATGWRFTNWDNLVVAASFENELLSVNLGGLNFDRLSEHTEEIRARQVAVVRDQIIIGDVQDDDGHTPNRLRWCGVNAPTKWDVDPATLADFRDLRGAGHILRIVPGRYGIVFTENDIWRLTWISSPGVWRPDNIDPGIGILASGAVAWHGSKVFFMNTDGFHMLDRGQPSQAIGDTRIDRTFLSRLDYNHKDRITSAIDSRNQLVFWAYPGPNNTNGQPNQLIVYNYESNRFAEGEEAVEILFEARTPGITIDDEEYFGAAGLYPILNSVPVSLDSPVWSGGSIELGAILPTGELALYSDDKKKATIETGELEIFPGRRTFLNEVISLFESSSITKEDPNLEIQVGTRNFQKEDKKWSEPRTDKATGRFHFHVDARYLSFRITTNCGDFGPSIGLDLYGSESGGR